MKRMLILAMGVMLAFGAVIPCSTYETAAASSIQFTDTKGHWAEETINDMVARGILDGFPDGTFRPNDHVKVDQFIKMLILSYSDLHQNGSRSWNADFLSSLSTQNQAILKQDYRYFTFKPNTVGYWAKDFIDMASDLNFLNKTLYSDFQAEMTREDVAEIIYYTLKETEFLEDSLFGQKMAQAFGDIKSANEREQRFIAETLVKGIMEGFPNGFFGVGDKVTRAESLVILSRLTNKSKRLAIKVSPDKLERVVPTAGGGSKVIVFPDQRMWDAYESLITIGQLRGANHDLYNTTLRLYKDQEELKNVQGQSTSSTAFQEEVAIWLDPDYNTYGITIRLREGSLARNQEAVGQFSNHLFGYNSITFKEFFAEISTMVEKDEAVTTLNKQIGTDNINVMIDTASKTVVFSISNKK